MSAATLVAWRKKPGDTIERGDVIALVETGKRLIDIEAFTTGVLEKILVEPGATVPTGTVLAIIRNGVSAEAAVTAAPGPPSPAAAPAAERPRVVPGGRHGSVRRSARRWRGRRDRLARGAPRRHPRSRLPATVHPGRLRGILEKAGAR